jgi:hypothetical protein
VPRGHDDDDLRSGGETGFDGVLPFIPDLAAPSLRVRFLTGLDRVINDDQIRRVARDAATDATAQNAAAMGGFQFNGVGTVDVANLDAEQLAALFFDLLLVPSHEASGKVIVVSGHDDAPIRVLAQYPRRQTLRHGH